MNPFAVGSVYHIMHEGLSALIGSAYPDADPALDADSGLSEFTSAIGYRTNRGAEECAREIYSQMLKSPPLFMGRGLVSDVTAAGGHVLFRLSADACSAAMRRVIGAYPQPELPDVTDTDTDYALARMLMLSRMGGSGCPDDQAVRRAVWLCLGIEGFEGAKREAVRRRAAAALLGMLKGRPFDEGEALRRRMGEVGRCAARCLALPQTDGY